MDGDAEPTRGGPYGAAESSSFRGLQYYGRCAPGKLECSLCPPLDLPESIGLDEASAL
jgi:hypothetical protein